MATSVITQREPPEARTAGAPPIRMSYEEYLAWEQEGGIAEWVNGEVHIQMTASHEHQNVVEFLHVMLDLFVRLSGLGKVRIAPFAMRAKADGPAREPDVLFIASEHLGRLESRQLNGPADLIVEVISDDSVARDRDEKFYEYQDAGVREYWIVDPRPNRQRADFYVLNANGRYQPVPINADNTYRSAVLPGFWLRVDWLWQEEPNPLAALAEIVGSEKLIAAIQAKP